MKQTNLWQCGFQAAYLFLGLCVFGQDSELLRAMRMISYRPSLCVEIALFCACAALGQVLIFRVVKEFGSLVWVTISVTRQLFTILLSVMLFGHHVNAVQWLGVILVFAGLGIDIAAGYGVKLKSDFGWDGKLESLVDVLTRCVQDALAGDVAGRGSASRVGRGGAGSAGSVGAGGGATTGLARPGLASRSGSTDFVDIEGQVAASPGSATATRKRWTAGSDKNKAD
jgi:UDP-galactose transporter B1